MKERVAKAVENAFEKFLWNSRFIVLLAVVSSMISSMILFVVATVDVFGLINKVFNLNLILLSVNLVESEVKSASGLPVSS